MKDRNSCVESGCRGYCCEDIDVIVTKFERRRLFPKSQRVGTLRELEERKTERQGVFYTCWRRKPLDGAGFNVIAINGSCPNRLPDGSCKKHEEREHAARNFKIGCQECNDIREEHGLAPIFFEPVE